MAEIEFRLLLLHYLYTFMSGTVLKVLHEYGLIPTILYSGYYSSLQMRKLRLLRVSNLSKVTKLVNGEIGTQIPIFLTLKLLDALEKNKYILWGWNANKTSWDYLYIHLEKHHTEN